MKKVNKKNRKSYLIIAIAGIVTLIIGVVILKNTDKIFNKNNNIKTSLIQYKFTGEYKDNHLVVSDGKKLGYVDSSGNVIFPLENNLADTVSEDYDLENYYFVDGLAKYYADGVYGIIDSDGNIKVDARFGDIEIYSKDVIIVSETFGSYILDSNFTSYFNDTYVQILANRVDLEHFIAVRDSFKYGIIDRQNKVIIDFKYDNISYLNNSDNSNYLYIAQYGNKYDVYTKEFKKVDVDNVNTVFWFDNNIISYMDFNGNVHTYDINNQKDEVYDSKYSFVYKYTDGLSLVTKAGEYGYINPAKEEVIATKYNYSATEFINGYAAVCNASDSGIECGIIDKTGKEVIELKYDDIKILSNKNFIIRDGEAMYIADFSGNKLTSEYKYIKEVENGKYFIVMDKDGKVGILDSDYKVFEDLKYTDIKYNENVFTLKVENGFYLLKV